MDLVSVEIDDSTLEQATKLLEEKGIDMETALNLFLEKVLECGGIPFDITIK